MIRKGSVKERVLWMTLGVFPTVALLLSCWLSSNDSMAVAMLGDCPSSTLSLGHHTDYKAGLQRKERKSIHQAITSNPQVLTTLSKLLAFLK